MRAPVMLTVMTSSFFHPSFAFSSQLDADGAPLSELSWTSSLAVIAISFSGLFTFVFLMLACLCCKKGEIGFKEFENAEGDEYEVDLSTLASPASQGGTEVYILPMTEVSLPASKQPGRSVQLLKTTDLGRHSLLYLKEIGHGWFGKVLLGEVHSGLSTIQVVVKELKASASVQDQMQFLEEAQPYRALQHPALLQCLAQCTDVTPYLLVMEFCPLGDLKGYLRSCHASDSLTPDPLILQRMASEIASGLLHLHEHNYIHSDLALRNCLLTAEMTVKIGDYGLSHNKYKEDYFVTCDQLWVPLRWIAPELIDEVHGNLLIVDQTKPSNIWSLGVTMWELFELGNQPYRHYTDRQVLAYTVKEQQLKLPKPLMKVPLAERWYEVMQFCWLQPDQRPTAEEVHLLLRYLCAKIASEAEDDFEKRWNSMRPNTSHSCSHSTIIPAPSFAPSSSSSSFPLLERFSAGDGYHSESGDDMLTVMETSHGLNFEYKWEQALPEQPYHSASTSGPLGQGNPHYQDIYYPSLGSCGVDGMSLGVSPSYYDPKQMHTPGVIPILSAHSPSVNSEYYIRLEEPVECNIDFDYGMCEYSPEYVGGNDNFVTGSSDSGECIKCASQGHPSSYWSGDANKTSNYDSDSSPAISLTMEPLLGQGSSPVHPWESGHYVSYKDRDGGYYYDSSPSMGTNHYIMEDPCEPQQESWGSRSLRQALGELENPLGMSPSLGSTRNGYSNPCLGGECYFDMMGSLRKTMPGPHSVTIDMETEGALFVSRHSSKFDEDCFTSRELCDWRNNSTNNAFIFDQRLIGRDQVGYVDFHYTMPSTDVEDTWPRANFKKKLTSQCAKPYAFLEAVPNNRCYTSLSKHSLISSSEQNKCIYLGHGGEPDRKKPAPSQTVDCHYQQFIDPLSGVVVSNYVHSDNLKDKQTEKHCRNKEETSFADVLTSKAQLSEDKTGSVSLENPKQYPNIEEEKVSKKEMAVEENTSSPLKDTNTIVQTIDTTLEKVTVVNCGNSVSEDSQVADSGLERGCSSISLVDIDDCSDEDITDVTSGIFTDFPTDTTNALKSLQEQVRTPDSIDSIDLPSTSGSCEALSPASVHTPSPPKALDSGYDTENNESPEFVVKEHHEPLDSEGFTQLLGPLCKSPIMEVEPNVLKTQLEMEATSTVMSASHSTELKLCDLNEENPYRDSAYFSDYDTDNERASRNETEDTLEKTENNVFSEKDTKEEDVAKSNEQDALILLHLEDRSSSLLPEKTRDFDIDIKKMPPRELTEDKVIGSSSVPILSMLSPSPPEMGGCLTKESSQDDGLGLDSEPSGEEPPTECSTSTISGGSSTEHITLDNEGNKPLDSESTAENSNIGTRLESKDKEINSEEEDKEEENTVDLPETKTDNYPLKESNQEKDAKKETEGKGCLVNTEQAKIHSPPPRSIRESRISKADGEEADSEDSEESDEELCCYNLQEKNEDSEEESSTVPVVVSDCSKASHLRSLLKMPSLFTESFCEELDRKKKAVSFFDDVTVYLFDQESPTQELAEHDFPSGDESCRQDSEGKEPSQQEKTNPSDDSSDGNVSEESGGFEWEDDFPLLANTSPMIACISVKTTNPSQTCSIPENKPLVQYSRFTVSPTNVSRFSITHVSDSDLDSAGGSSEDGDRE